MKSITLRTLESYSETDMDLLLCDELIWRMQKQFIFQTKKGNVFVTYNFTCHMLKL